VRKRSGQVPGADAPDANIRDEAAGAEVQAAFAKLTEARRLIDEGLALLGGAVVHEDMPARVPRRMTRPPGESDELSAARARRILQEKGFVPR
jgi:hypothetical protein